MFITDKELEYYRENYKRGTRIKLIEMAKEPQMPSGLLGTVTHVDSIGQIHMNWDNGSTLALVPGEDSFTTVY